MVESLKRDAAEMLRGMVAIPSVTFQEKEVCDFIAGLLEGWGLKPERIGNNLLCGEADPAKKTLMMCAHIDTVPPCDEYAEIRGAICGLGSNDDGGSVAALTAVFRYFAAGRPLPFNLLLALTAEEERSGAGGMSLLWAERLAGKVDWAIVGEPTGMQAATSERGLLVIDGTARGVKGHAARNEGVNALSIAVDDIVRLREHRFSRVSEILGKVRLNVTQINAGEAHNVIPDLCTFVVDIRPNELYTNEEILNELQAECRSTLAARNLRNRSSATYPGSPLKACADRLGIPVFSSSTTSDWMKIGCDAVKMGPGDSARSHHKNEYLLESELFEAVDKYIRFIEDYADFME